MLIAWFVAGVGVLMMGFEARWPGRSWPRVSGWWARAAALTSLQVAVVYLAGIAWDPWLAAHRWLSAERIGVLPGALLGYLAITFVFYFWHRARHEVPWLWRWFHQVHHSPQRLEIITSFYKHPFEVLANGLLSSAVLYLVIGLQPAAAALAVLFTGLAELFYHWNVRTPRWLGFVIQRPESHCVHHEADHHSHNFADLPLWDWLFGTLHNPDGFDRECGLGGREHQLGRMLIGRDVTSGAR